MLSLPSRNAQYFLLLKQQLSVKTAGFRPNPGRPSSTSSSRTALSSQIDHFDGTCADTICGVRANQKN
jgi:hypothetical protein